MTTLNVGDLAPEFELPADNGETIRLSDFRGKRVVLYFYPKDDTPGCTTQACGFRDAYPQIEEQNAVVIGVSPDSVASHQKFKTKFDLPFLLVADENHSLAEAYGVWGEKSMYGKKYMGVTRSHFIIDENGYLLDVQGKISPADSVSGALKLLNK
ncbi:thioredoxin-dependent thiol peroxidase [Herpetosiphon llansteffanensis]